MAGAAACGAWLVCSCNITSNRPRQLQLALLKPRSDGYYSAHPGATDVLLLVEVSDATLAFDLDTKIPLYAHAGIAG